MFSDGSLTVSERGANSDDMSIDMLSGMSEDDDDDDEPPGAETLFRIVAPHSSSPSARSDRCARPRPSPTPMRRPCGRTDMKLFGISVRNVADTSLEVGAVPGWCGLAMTGGGLRMLCAVFGGGRGSSGGSGLGRRSIHGGDPCVL